MVKKFLEYDVDSLFTIEAIASFAREVQMLEYYLRHNDFGYKNSRLSYMPVLHQKLCDFHANKNVVAWLLKTCGFFEIKELLEKIMQQYKVEEKEVIING